ncbi:MULTISPECIES: protein-L-isoaspartate(D-aspartate) O-methyltransferase [Thermodesulfovibrio]|uniref:Protein-L-isoaspartate O-methyltransferase n=1 Tax=Thermodesulfovibrio yellowstonii (strain ATCC 51303 / DSM 11347 / YP87) TaxID=289376 RepID=B5YG96_THEYD|nr:MULTISPECIES: protein-L-isoaspartate(D-aspartate) O-methyltransferase [Thermodesulfovibrio]ACI21020.1 protein-L-isoaspartate O-methyltransferase [Thermodesulfovibrio yellowstonii DSM 11347]
MIDKYKKLREWMVDTQIVERGIRDERVIKVMKKIPRHLFVPENIMDDAYDDRALPIGYGQTISQPYIVALMTELLELKGDEKVLEIGTGSGYQAAILAELAKEVHTIERVEPLAKEAEKKFEKLSIKNIKVYVRDGTEGIPEEAPFDRIIITAATPDIPEPLIEQLKEGGIIVAPVGERYSQYMLKAIKKGKELERHYLIPVAFVPLIGKYGWKEE